MPEEVKEETKDVDALSELQLRLIQLHGAIGRLNTPRINFSSILEDERLLAIYHKEFSKVAKPLAYVKNLRVQFAKWHQSSPQLAIEEVRKRLQTLVNLINIFSPSEVVRLRKIVLALDRTEIDEIHKCSADVNRWTTFALENEGHESRIDFFFNRLAVYLRGGTLDGVQFLGLFSHFRDSQLAKELLTNDAIKRLRTFKKQIVFFRTAMYITLEALREGGNQALFWGTQEKNFKDGFYHNLRKGRKWIRVVREVYGNEDFAQLLERLDEKMHEYPEVWEREFKALSVKLNGTNYQNQHIIYPAMQVLLALFQRAIDRISRSEVGFKEIDDILEKLEKEVERRKKRLLREEIERFRKEFDEIDNPVVDEMMVIMPILFNYMYTLGVMPERRELGILQTSRKQSADAVKYASDIRKVAKAPGVALMDAVQTDVSALIKLQLANAPLVSVGIKSSVDALEARINKGLVALLQPIIKFIERHDNKFTTPISAAREMLPEVQETLSKMQDELKAEFKKEGIYLTRPMFG